MFTTTKNFAPFWLQKTYMCINYSVTFSYFIFKGYNFIQRAILLIFTQAQKNFCINDVLLNTFIPYTEVLFLLLVEPIS